MLFQPWGLLILAGVPALLAIYFLQRRLRRRQVSSLMLWTTPRLPQQGGRKWRRLRTPPPFWLELLIIALLALAAASPHFKLSENRRPLAVVLDDSFSMRAGEPQSPRERALQALLEEAGGGRHAPFHLVLAGQEASLLARDLENEEQLEQELASWKCQASRADLPSGIALARRLAGELGRVLVLSDQAPGSVPSQGEESGAAMPGEAQQTRAGASNYVQWSFGRPMGNLALVNAGRSKATRRNFVEVANWGPSPLSLTVTIETLDSRQAGPQPFTVVGSAEQRLEVQAGRISRLVFEVPSDRPVRVSLPGDSLGADDQVLLLPENRPKVRAAVKIEDPDLRQLLERALDASGQALLVEERPEILFLGAGDPPQDPLAEARRPWRFHIPAQSGAVPQAGPLVVDRTHPLGQGLSLSAAIWAASPGPLPGTPVISSDNIPLVSARRALDASFDLWMRLYPPASNVQRTADWPIFFFNLLTWRQDMRPGPQRVNLRSGEAVQVGLRGSGQLDVEFPDGSRHSLTSTGGELSIPAPQPGLYRLRPEEGGSYSFVANLLHADESDLRAAASGRWGDWIDQAARRWEYADLTWFFLLAALAVLLFHQALTGGWLSRLGTAEEGGA
ncbi:MAG TPA: BatA domain-containing protein [Acidobacteriota bacterium]|nr:BatA domain-containing protein [Acidobacteriota bacterium]